MCHLRQLKVLRQPGRVPGEHERAVDGGVREAERVAELVRGDPEQTGRRVIVVRTGNRSL